MPYQLMKFESEQFLDKLFQGTPLSHLENPLQSELMRNRRYVDMENYFNPNRLSTQNVAAFKSEDENNNKNKNEMNFKMARSVKMFKTSSSSNSPRNSVISTSSERGRNFKVVIRVRPPLPRELGGDKPFQNVTSVDQSGHVLSVSENAFDCTNTNAEQQQQAGCFSNHVFTFDQVYDQHCNQRSVYENTAKGVVESSLEGYNATIFAYGQTGTGKTYTMEGFNSGGSLEDRGIIPRAIEQIFQHIQSNVSARMRFLVRASYLQIYNESISDLLKPERNNLSIREDKKRGVFVEGLSEWVVRSPEEIYGLMERGGSVRATGSTKMNEISSRSHAVFIIIAEQSMATYVDSNGKEMSTEEFTNLMNKKNSRDRSLSKLDSMVRQSFKVGKLNLVDLAGSERVRLSGATGQRLEESKKINQSLSALGNVISALTDSKGRQHIPYRDSKLTRILEDSLGGNCKTTMMAMISPALEAMVESLSTLKFANRAKNIKNEARVNEDLDQKSLLRKYERELKRLRSELDERSQNVVDKRRLLELDEQRRRAEADKMAAIRALEERSVEFMREKEEKRRLEQRISTLTSQMLMKNGSNEQFKLEDSDINKSNQFSVALKEHQDKIRKEYECRLADLEKERETIEEEKAQVDRYKQLLLKQRDIMIALTQRLNERDEQIMALQDELDAYDRHQKQLEEKLDEKTAQLIHLQRVTIENDANSPTKSKEVAQALGDWASSTSANGSAEDFTNTSANSQYLLELKNKNMMIRDLQQEKENLILAYGEEKKNDTIYERRLMESEEKNKKLQMLISNLEKNMSIQNKDLENQCSTLLKERRAVQTIMEQKIKALVDAVCSASTATFESVGGSESEAGRWLTREISALQRLVNASIAALRNAATDDGRKKELAPDSSKNSMPLPPSLHLSNFKENNFSVESLIQQRRQQLQRNSSIHPK